MTSVRGSEDREGAFCIDGRDAWPSSCGAPATHALRISEDAHGQPYETHSCAKHLSTTGDALSTRYRSDDEAAAALPAIEAFMRERVHPNDLPTYLERLYAAVA